MKAQRIEMSMEDILRSTLDTNRLIVDPDEIRIWYCPASGDTSIFRISVKNQEEAQLVLDSLRAYDCFLKKEGFVTDEIKNELDTYGIEAFEPSLGDEGTWVRLLGSGIKCQWLDDREEN